MSVKQTPENDPSTANYNWGTLVILLVLVIAGVVIAAVLHAGGQTPPVKVIN